MKLSLFTVSYAGLWGQHQLTLEDAIRKAAELGYQGVELMGKRPHFSPLDWSLEDCRTLKTLLEAENLELSAVAGYTNFTGGAKAPEVPSVELQIAYVEQLAMRAQALGGNLVRIFSSYEQPGVALAGQWQKTVDAIGECCDRAARYGVTVGVQNHHDLGVATKTFAELIRQIDRPNVTPMYDCWCVHLRGEDLAAGASQMAPQMQFTTVADYITLPRSQYQPKLVNYRDIEPPWTQAVPMGEGELDYHTFFNSLKESEYKGWVSFEMCSPVRGGGTLENLDHCAATFIEYMRKWL